MHMESKEIGLKIRCSFRPLDLGYGDHWWDFPVNQIVVNSTWWKSWRLVT